MISRFRGLLWLALVLFGTSLIAFAAANNPIPQAVGPPVPQAVVPGSGAFTLTVYGANFVSGAIVNWNRSPRSTTFISARELQAQILASDVASPTAGYITVTNPPPDGGVSSSSYGLVEVHTPTKTIVVGPPNVYLQNLGARMLVLSDFDNDGTLDLAFNYGRSEIELLHGNGDGTFRLGSVATHYYDGNDVAGISSGDFNNDGNEDLIFGANPNEPPSQIGVTLVAAEITHRESVRRVGVLSVILGRGDGSFKHRADYNELGPSEVQTADFNGDGILDLAVLRPSGNGGLHVRMGKGDGRFSTSQVVDANPKLGCDGFAPTLYISDFNGDGKADFAYCWTDAPRNKGKIRIALGNGDGTFRKPVSLTVHPYQGVFSFTVGDFNSDGKTDLLANYITSINPIRSETDLFRGNGDGTFKPKQVIKLPGADFYNAENGFVLADFNSDGLLDFISKAPGEFDVFIQKK